MSTMLIQSDTLSDIADAIRSKTGGSNTMTPLEMPTEISNIPTGGGGASILQIGSVTPSAYSGYSNSYTCDKQGTLYVGILKQNSISNPSVNKNGTGLSLTTNFGTATWWYTSSSVNVGDIINLSTGNVGGGSASIRLFVLIV